eukprot:TRINITY_DN5956_c0_g1_i1.p1 TRINITY_DN5956_c0_g1~~TRINITY_DN5956_c0_g1_i1.p1  ORF type:complete len:149 (+),score=20.64 TRINITY_DN5956_c0_g1_i1:416-862(+)
MKDMGRLQAAFLREKSEVICPKPRRLGLLLNKSPDTANPIPCQERLVHEHDGQYAGLEIVDIVFGKNETNTLEEGSSSPYFCGSPPSRADNPLVHDAQFIHQKVPSSPTCISKPKPCSRPSYGSIPAIRVEGFDCLDRDTRQSVPAIA